MTKQNGTTNGSHDESWKDVEELKKRLDALSEKDREHELDKLTPVELHDLFALTAYINLSKKRRRRT